MTETIVDSDETSGYFLNKIDIESKFLKFINDRHDKLKSVIIVETESVQTFLWKGENEFVRRCSFKGNKNCAMKTVITPAKTFVEFTQLEDSRYFSQLFFWFGSQEGEFIDPSEFDEYMKMSHEQRMLHKKINIGVMPLYHIFFSDYEVDGEKFVTVNYIMPAMLGSSVDFHKETKENRGRQAPGFRKWINSDFYNYINESGDRNKYLDLFCFYCFSALDRIHNNYRYKNKTPTFIHANIKPENIMYYHLGIDLNPDYPNFDNIAFFLSEFDNATRIDGENLIVNEPFVPHRLFNDFTRPAFLSNLIEIKDMTDVPFDKFTDGKTFKSKNDDDDDDNKDKYGISYLMDFTGMARLMVYFYKDVDRFFFRNAQIAEALQLNSPTQLQQNSSGMYQLKFLLFAFAASFPDSNDVTTLQKNLVSFYNNFCALYIKKKGLWIENMKREKSIYIRYVYYLILEFTHRPSTIEEIIEEVKD